MAFTLLPELSQELMQWGLDKSDLEAIRLCTEQKDLSKVHKTRLSEIIVKVMSGLNANFKGICKFFDAVSPKKRTVRSFLMLQMMQQHPPRRMMTKLPLRPKVMSPLRPITQINKVLPLQAKSPVTNREMKKRKKAWVTHKSRKKMKYPSRYAVITKWENVHMEFQVVPLMTEQFVDLHIPKSAPNLCDMRTKMGAVLSVKVSANCFTLYFAIMQNMEENVVTQKSAPSSTRLA